MREHEYWRFCLDHTREYNSSYNYFAGMSDDAVARYQKDAVTGHRPTWKMGLNGGADRLQARTGHDPFDVLREFGAGPSARMRHRSGRRRRRVRCATPSARPSTRSIWRSTRAAAEIKARFKELVKRHHPDANGGDRSTEDRLRRDHSGVQLSEVGEVLLSGISRATTCRSRSPHGTAPSSPGTQLNVSVNFC